MAESKIEWTANCRLLLGLAGLRQLLCVRDDQAPRGNGPSEVSGTEYVVVYTDNSEQRAEVVERRGRRIIVRIGKRYYNLPRELVREVREAEREYANGGNG